MPTEQPTTQAPGAPDKPETPSHLLPGQAYYDPAKPHLNPLNQLPTRAAPNTRPPTPALTAQVKESQFVIREFTVFIPREHTPQMLMEASYWMHNAPRLKIHDKLDCISESGGWEVTLRVVNKGDTWVKMRMLSGYEAKENEAAAPLRDSYKVDFVPSQLHRVVHKDTKSVISSGHQTKDAAMAALDQHIESLTRRQ